VALGRIPRRGSAAHRHPRQDLELAADRPEHDPARREGDRGLFELDARGARSASRGVRDDGFIADGSGENVFIVKDGTIYTPDLSASILPGITRDSLIQIAQDLGHSVVEKPLIRTDLYLADEVFMCGTAAEVTPIREVDDQVVGPPGPVTLEIQEAYLDTVHGRTERWAQWLEFAPAANTQA